MGCRDEMVTPYLRFKISSNIVARWFRARFASTAEKVEGVLRVESTKASFGHESGGRGLHWLSQTRDRPPYPSARSLLTSRRHDVFESKQT